LTRTSGAAAPASSASSPVR